MSEEKIKFSFLPRDVQKSVYDWANINVGDVRIGKARCSLEDNLLIVYSINIFPEYEGKGYGRAFIEAMKLEYDVIVADRVRHSAIGFWERLGFVPYDDGAYIFRKMK